MDAAPSTPAPAPLTLPLFPLQTVLFPGGLLPLQIFEVRYLDMIGRCHKAGTPFGVVSLTQGSEVRRPAPSGQAAGSFADEDFHDIGTLAQIVGLERPQPGLMMIRCVGGRRFRLSRRERLPHGLWMGDAELLPEDAPVQVPEDLEATAQTLREVVRQLTARQTDPAAMPLQPPLRWDDCGWVANRWAELLPVEPAVRQQLMALDGPLLRLELVADVIERLRRAGPPADAG